MHYRLKIYFYVVIIVNFCEISQINIYSNALEKIQKKPEATKENLVLCMSWFAILQSL